MGVGQLIPRVCRDILKIDLAECTLAEQKIFKRMYSADNINKPINLVVDDMPTNKLEWATRQVQRTLDKKSTQIELL